MRPKAFSAAAGRAEKRPPPRCSGAASSVASRPARKTRLCVLVRAEPQLTTMRSTASGKATAQW